MYVFNTELNLPMDEVITKLQVVLADEGLGVVSDINIQGVIRSSLEDKFQPYMIVGACAPGLARSLISVDPDIGALLPCNIVVQELDGRTKVSFMDPIKVLGLANKLAINDIARQVRDILERVATRLQN